MISDPDREQKRLQAVLAEKRIALNVAQEEFEVARKALVQHRAVKKKEGMA